MELLWQLLVNGVILGSEYALLGVSWGIIFHITGTFHFAHGAVFSVGAYGAIFFSNVLGWPLLPAVMAGITVAVIVGMAMERYAYAPMRRIGATPMTVLITSLGMLIILQNVFPILFGSASRTFPDVNIIPIELGSAFFTNVLLYKVIAAWGLFGAVMAFLYYTRPGKALRAVGSNPEMAQVVGFNIGNIYLLAYAIGSALAAVAGVLQTMDTGASPANGTFAVIIASMSVLLGGMGSLTGSALGGFFIGMAMSLSIWKLPSEWQLTVGFGLLIILITVRPRGFLGGKLTKTEV